MKQTIELLAPAGTYEAFLAAVENGADAVYLGGKLFNARANASNFDLEELKKIVEYAHLRGVKIHLTMNTLLTDQELKEALDFAYSIYEIGVDAVIVQDLGLAKLLHEAIPNLTLHASTQLSTHTLEGVEALAKLGFSRVVLARELSLEEIRFICEHTETEIEIFAHGALCVSYSGQCLMSSMIGDRSGNRGKCAQPCRLPYQLIKNQQPVASGYLLSPKDLSTLEILKDLPPVACLKIEGRMKSPEYVATVTRIYRAYLDKASSIVPSEKDKNELAQVFNRGGFSRAYLYGKTGKDMMCYEKPKNWGLLAGKVTNYDGKKYITLDHAESLKIGDGIEVWNGSNQSPSTIISEIIGNKIGRIHGDIHVGDKVYKTSDKLLNQSARESFSRGFRRRSPVALKIFFQENEPVQIQINDFLFRSTILPQKAENQPLTKEKIISQFSKTGNTPFEVKQISVQLGNELFLPIGLLNEIRREALDAYEKEILKQTPKKIERKDFANLIPTISTKKTPSKPGSRKVSVFFTELKEEYVKLENVNAFYFSFRDALKQLDWIKQFHGKKYLVLPTITKGNYDKLIRKNLSKLATQVNGFVLSHIGQLAYFEGISTELIANYTFNCFNTFSIQLLKDLGFSKIILSPELTKSQIQALPFQEDLEIIAYGKTCTMTSEYCPIGSLVGGLSSKQKCSMPCLKKDIYYLRDRMNLDFRLLPDSIDCQCKIFNAKTTSIETKDLAVSSIRLDMLDEPISEIQAIIQQHQAGKKMTGEAYTNGHFNRPV